MMGIDVLTSHYRKSQHNLTQSSLGRLLTRGESASLGALVTKNMWLEALEIHE